MDAILRNGVFLRKKKETSRGSGDGNLLILALPILHRAIAFLGKDGTSQ